MSRFADLHIHTHFSDSSSSPQEVVGEAIGADLYCIAITDHDTIDGVIPAQRAAEGHDLEVIPGIELSSEFSQKDIHILGYFVDCEDPALRQKLDEIQESRITRMKGMIQKLKEQGIHNIEFEDVMSRTEAKSVGRPHLATVLFEKGWVGSLREAFDKFIGEECPAYVGKYKQTPYEAIDLIRKAGGISVMAHPMITQKDELIPSFVDAGLQGIEVYYPNYSNNSISFYEGLAKKYNLVTTGGSDAHGKARPGTFIGKRKIPYEIVEQLKRLKEANAKSL